MPVNHACNYDLLWTCSIASLMIGIGQISRVVEFCGKRSESTVLT